MNTFKRYLTEKVEKREIQAAFNNPNLRIQATFARCIHRHPPREPCVAWHDRDLYYEPTVLRDRKPGSSRSGSLRHIATSPDIPNQDQPAFSEFHSRF